MPDPTRLTSSSTGGDTWTSDMAKLVPGAVRSVQPINRTIGWIGVWANAVHDLIYTASTGLRDRIVALESNTRSLLATSLTATGEVQAEHLHTTDDLEVGDDATIGGDLAVTGAITVTGNLSTSGIFSSPNVVKFRAVRTDVQALDDDPDSLFIFNDETSGSYGFNQSIGGTPVYSTTTGQFTVPADHAGYYRFEWGVGTASHAWADDDAVVTHLRVEHNSVEGTAQLGSKDVATGAETRTMYSGGSALLYLSAGDKVCVRVAIAHDSNVDSTTIAGYNFFSGMRVA